ncbi:sodium/proline symporter PutP [Fastidiosibacter lacustris]|uniref:sodium/proline symporter PutP n=1 Tax=Fastidiosibacter lacustris TaxID=2056695 RepID=UPI000E34FC69|nr:sodium/proline symporter PutP [Fastidiosibacter lacustris]
MSALVIVFVLYIVIIFGLAVCSYFYTKNLHDYMLGGRSLSGPIAALGAGASDMSSWLLLALPGTVMLNGLNQIWLPIGLALGAYLNWQFVARRLRVYTEMANDSITIPSYFENRFGDKTGLLRLLSAIVILIFFTFYTASGFVAGGLLFGSTFQIDYSTGLYITAFIILVYTCIGGFLAISWVDFFQGSLMFIALIIVPIAVWMHIGSLSDALTMVSQQSSVYLNVFKDTTLVGVISLFAWGLGYFGQPHILVRFMATKTAKSVPQAQFICMTWMCIALLGAVFTGLLGIAYFAPNMLQNPETVFVLLSQMLFDPWVAGALLAAVLSATMSTASAQLLASSSAVVEDFYHKFIRPYATVNEMLIVSRIVVLMIAIIAMLFALNPKNSILNLVGYAWAGLGASFGPIIILSLYWRRMNLVGAFAGIVVGALTVIIWPYLKFLGGFFELYELLPGFIFACVAIVVASLMSKIPNQLILEQYSQTKERL